MKKLFIALLCLLLIAGLCACGQTETATDADEITASTGETTVIGAGITAPNPKEAIAEETTTKGTTTTKTPTTMIPPKVDIPTSKDDPYSYIIKDRYDIVYNQYCEYGYYEHLREYYALYDIDDNGTKALLHGQETLLKIAIIELSQATLTKEFPSQKRNTIA